MIKTKNLLAALLATILIITSISNFLNINIINSNIREGNAQTFEDLPAVHSIQPNNTQKIDDKAVTQVKKQAIIDSPENVEDMNFVSTTQNIYAKSFNITENPTVEENPIFANGDVLIKFKTLEGKKNFAVEKGTIFDQSSKSKLTNLKVGTNLNAQQTQDIIKSLK